jgi:hypothetical protein
MIRGRFQRQIHLGGRFFFGGRFILGADFQGQIILEADFGGRFYFGGRLWRQICF